MSRNADKVVIEFGFKELVDLCRFFRRGLLNANKHGIGTSDCDKINNKLSDAMEKMRDIKAKARLSERVDP